MKAAIKSTILAAFLSASGIANSDNLLVAAEGNRLIGIVYASCAIGVRDGRPFSEVSVVDHSHDLLPVPREGSTCAEYTAALIESGARVDTSTHSCWASPVPMENRRLCIAVFAALYG